MEKTALILGCGYLGCRVAQRWKSQNWRVLALTRSQPDTLTALGIEPIVGDVLNPSTLAALPTAETVLYAIGLDSRAGVSMREVYVHGLANVLGNLTARRIIYVSSTSVYGQTDGSEVTEESPTEPQEESGRVVLEAELTLRRRRPDAVILRFAGIYGPNRLLRRQSSLLAGDPISCDPEGWLNLIHVDDGTEAVLAAAERAEEGSTFNVSDGTPVRRVDFYAELARQIGAPAPTFAPAPPGPNRRIGTQKIRHQLGFQPRFASYREGLTSILSEPERSH